MSSSGPPGAGPVVAGEASRLRLLQLATLTSTCDRFALAPLLVVISRDLGVDLVAVATTAGGYFLAYGLMQPVWGLAGDRLGRVRVMRLAVAGAALCGVVSMLAPTLAVLAMSRVLGGAFVSALIPTSLVYIGDSWPPAVRQRPVSDVLAASALGTAVATAAAGALADLVSWRAVFALTGAAAAVLWVALRRLPEPPRTAPAAANPLRPLGQVLATRWAWVVLALALAEGAAVLGALTFVAPALQSQGWSAAVAGLVAGGFGAAAMLTSRVVRRLVGRWSTGRLAAVGGVCLALAWVWPAVHVGLAAVLASGLLLGGAWAFLHSTLQTWATEVVPQARAAAVALFAAVLFVGSSVGTTLTAPLADAGAYRTVFAGALLLALPLAVAAVVTRMRYSRHAT